jgi:enoyl-CoA hydratase
MSNALSVEDIDRQVIVRFNRPEIRSPLSIAVVEQLTAVVIRIDDAQVERVIFTGVGDVFASGADLREIRDLAADRSAEFALRGQNLMNIISALEPETVAAVNGICFGGALDLALACDRRIASPAAIFSHPGATLGIITGWGGTQRLPRLVGEAKALEMFFTSARIDADEALAIGLVDRISVDPAGDALNGFQQ